MKLMKEGVGDIYYRMHCEYLDERLIGHTHDYIATRGATSIILLSRSRMVGGGGED